MGRASPCQIGTRGLTNLCTLETLFATVEVSQMKFSLQQLSDRADMPGRTIRFYIQRGLLPGPKGEKRGAYYTSDHLAELLRIRQWQEAGLSLDAIGELLQAKNEAPVSPARPGAVEVRSHLIVADGIELVVAADRAGLTQTQLRQLFRAVQSAYSDLLDRQQDPEQQ
jgi:DNA-binding transcriptional MerR regulator